MNVKYNMYDAKNHINWEWAEGMPYSEYKKFVFLANGLGSCSKCFKTVLHISLSKTPTKKAIWKIPYNRFINKNVNRIFYNI